MKRKPAVILLEKFSSTNRSDWREQLQAGCKIWVNHTSGEVSTICPWSSTKDVEEALKGTIPHSENIGTGSIVYDGAEFGEFMTALDRLSVNRTLKTPKWSNIESNHLNSSFLIPSDKDSRLSVVDICQFVWKSDGIHQKNCAVRKQWPIFCGLNYLNYRSFFGQKMTEYCLSLAVPTVRQEENQKCTQI